MKVPWPIAFLVAVICEIAVITFLNTAGITGLVAYIFMTAIPGTFFLGTLAYFSRA